jgi:hypothetical protein
MTEDEALAQLPLVDRLGLLAFDLELQRAPRALIAAVWDGRDAVALAQRIGRSVLDTPGTKP